MPLSLEHTGHNSPRGLELIRPQRPADHPLAEQTDIREEALEGLVLQIRGVHRGSGPSETAASPPPDPGQPIGWQRVSAAATEPALTGALAVAGLLSSKLLRPAATRFPSAEASSRRPTPRA